MTIRWFIAAAVLIGAGTVSAERLTVPVDLGVAPALHMFTGPIQKDQRFHYGLKLSLGAVLDQATLKRHQNRIPAKYRKRLSRVSEVRLYPLWYLPDTLLISPRTGNTGTQMYGVTFRPIGIGLSPVAKPVRVNLSAGALLTYAFIQSNRLLSPKDNKELSMHFFRPGLEFKVDLEFPLSKSFLLSLGWASQLYVPQEVHGKFTDVKGVDNAVWHVGQTYLMFHFRFPYTTSI